MPAFLRHAFLVLLALSSAACVQPDAVLSVDKSQLEFTLRSRLENHPCTDTAMVPEGTCLEGETAKAVWVPGVPSPKTIRLNNSSGSRFYLSVGIGVGSSTTPSPDRPPFRIRAQSSGVEDWSTTGEIEIGPRSEVEIQVLYQGSMLDRAGLEAIGRDPAAGTVFPNNQRLIIRLLDGPAGEVRTDADGGVIWEGAPNGIVLLGSVDCQSLGWDQDRDGFCDESSLASFEPAGDCADQPGALGFHSNPDGDEVCEDDGAGGIALTQVDNDCDGFRVRNGDTALDDADQDGDGVCDFDKACVPDFAQLTADDVLAYQTELAVICGNALDDCDDNPVNGALRSPLHPEICEPGDPSAQFDANCDPSDDSDGLTWFAVDEDGDGFAAPTQPLLPVPFPVRYCGPPPEFVTGGRNATSCGGGAGGAECGTPDCDDSRSTVFPGAPTFCDGQDNDCDGIPDTPDDVDADNDGQAQCQGDCDDNNNDVKVGAPEICDGEDNNCDGTPDANEVDNDGDDYFQCAGVPFKVELQVALQPTNELRLFAAPGLSVADTQAITVETVTGAAEGIVESGTVVTVTFIDTASTTNSLKAMITAEVQAGALQLIGLATGAGTHAWTAVDEAGQNLPMVGTLGNDCDDADPLINPGASEVNALGLAFCDGRDNNCDGVPHPNESDDDFDGMAECSPSTQAGPAGEALVLTAPPRTVTAAPMTVTFVAAAAEAVTEDVGNVLVTIEFVDGVSTTGSLVSTLSAALGGLGLIDGAFGSGSTPWSLDREGDVFMGLIAGGDCNDTSDEINLTAAELCDGYDNDCDGLLGDGTVGPDEGDADGDGWVPCTPNSVNLAGTVLGMAGGNDCQDDPFDPTQPRSVASSDIYPGAPELADSYFDTLSSTYILIDNQCPGDAGYDANGIPGVGEYCESSLISASTCIGSATVSCFSCIAGELDGDGDGYSAAAGDCDDTNPQMGPQMLEICDGFDNNCDTFVPVWDQDDDGDGYLVCSPAIGVPLLAGMIGGGDCNDANGTVNPGQAELADGLDTDCDASTNAPGEVDGDGDGYCPGISCNGALIGGDCDDGNTAVNPGASELCDELDTNCDLSLGDGTSGTPDETDDDGDGYTVCDPSNPAAINDCLEHASQILTAFPTYPVSSPGVPVNWQAAAASVHPFGVEVCDGWNNDCSNGVFAPTAAIQSDEFDDDNDRFVDCFDTAEGTVGWTAFLPQANRALNGANDCADVPTDADDPSNPNDGPTTGPLATVFPGAVDACDGWDNPCLGSNPPFIAPHSAEWDDDLDRYLDCAQVAITTGAVNSAGATILGGFDCLDDPSVDTELPGGLLPATGGTVTVAMANSVHPGAAEVCDGWNTDCDLNGAATGGETLAVLPSAADIANEVDDDGDDFIPCGAAGLIATAAPGLGGFDCLDVALTTNAYSDNVNPAAAEICDSWDTDCSNTNGGANDGEPEDPDELDNDNDRFIPCDFDPVALAGGAANNGFNNGTRQVTGGSDCLDVALTANSYSDDVHPAAAETCDSWDTDCSSQPAYPANLGAPELAEERDEDGDGFAQCDFSAAALAGGAANNGLNWDTAAVTVISGSDCLDVALTANAYSNDVNPAATETCDSWDTDCSNQPAYPGNIGTPEIADELDHDFDGYIPCDFSAAAIAGGAVNNGIRWDNVALQTVLNGSDCLDVPTSTNAYSNDVRPGAAETCDSWDTDCDSQPPYPANDGFPEDVDEIDDDGDGYIPCDFSAFALGGGAAGNGYGGITNGSDCLDVLVTANGYSDDVNPGEPEVCDSWDTDCSNQPAYPSNNGVPHDTNELDLDGDGYVHCDFSASVVSNGGVGNGFSGATEGSDCLDVALSTNAYSDDVNPGIVIATEVCDGWDTDCSHQPAFPGNDGEPCGDDGLCPSEPGYPGADAGEDALDEYDADNDGYIGCPMIAAAVGLGPAVGTQNPVLNGGDCLDVVAATNPYSFSVRPTATEVCDGWDTDCSHQPVYPANDGRPCGLDGRCPPQPGYVSADAGELASEIDNDGDQYVDCSTFVTGAGARNQETVPELLLGGRDCLDVASTYAYSTGDSISLADASNVFPGAAEACDGFDTNCSQYAASASANTFNPDVSNEQDDDFDFFLECTGITSWAPASLSDADCDDDNGSTNPGVTSDLGTPTTNAQIYRVDNDCDDVYDEDSVVAGEIAVTEILASPTGGASQWIELFNSSARDISINRWRFDDSTNGESFVPDETATLLPNTPPLVVPAGSYAIVCSNPSAYPAGTAVGTAASCLNTVGWTASGFALRDVPVGSEDLDIFAAGRAVPLLVDELSWSTDLSPLNGSSVTLDVAAAPFHTNNNAPDVNGSANWCQPHEVWSGASTDLGTPGLQNSSCDPDKLDLDNDGWCADGEDTNGDGDCDDLGEDLTGTCPGGICDCFDSLTDTYAASVNPDASATDVCDGFDTDCSNAGVPPNDEVDDDGDDYLPCDNYVSASTSGFIDGHDCFDTGDSYSDNVNPGASELCDGYDTNCSVYVGGGTNTNVADVADEQDDDGDDYLPCDNWVAASTSGFIDGHDCFDTTDTYSDNVNPGATELCDGYDTDCSVYVGGGANTRNPERADEQDDDADTYLPCDNWVGASTAAFTDGHDCMDVPTTGGGSNSYSDNINPGSAELCDGFDTNCSVYVGGGANVSTPDQANEIDDDGDNYLPCDNWVSASTAGFTDGHDCLDVTVGSNSYSDNVNPGASELCDGYDTNCSVYVGGGANVSTADQADEVDDDGDTYLPCDNWVAASTAPFTDGHDCLDVTPGTNLYSDDVNPGEAEVCDGYDTNCSVYVGGGANVSTADQADERDDDGDGYLPCDNWVATSTAGFTDGHDCLDELLTANAYSANVKPGVADACDGYDTNCSVYVSGGANVSTPDVIAENDDDNDQYIECSGFVGTTTARNSQNELLLGGGDCGDTQDFRYPGAPELCNAIDDDCNTVVDDGLDGDLDGVTTCGPDGVNGTADDDCLDTNAAVKPGASEICDGFDSDCSAFPGYAQPANEVDDDGDGRIECDTTGVVTLRGGLTGGLDCLDVPLGTNAYSANVRPGLAEVCDGYDTDCSTAGTVPANEVDDDNDQYIECSSFVGTTTARNSQNELLLGGLDCLDVAIGTNSYSGNVRPGVAESCDGYDTDCSAAGTVPTNEVDDDNDQYIECSSFVGTTTARNGENELLLGGLDCLDVTIASNAYSGNVRPGVAESCDGYDTDCSAAGTVPANERDDDNDQYIPCSSFVGTTTARNGQNELLLGGLDCLDVTIASNSYSGDVRPGVAEACDGYDTDCSAAGTVPTNEVDDDNDQYIECSGFVGTTTARNGQNELLLGGGDCLDVTIASNSYSGDVRPNAGAEVCDGYDTDCSTAGTPPANELDEDNDQYIECSGFVTTTAQNGQNETLLGGLDCLDVTLASNSYSGNVRPGATEVCDGYDTDCSAAGTVPTNEVDEDNDQYIECGSFVTTTAKNGENETLLGGLDCLDVALGTNSYSGNVRPGAPAEVCDGYDTDCTTAGTPPANERDDDNDQYIECGSFVTTTAQNGENETLLGGLDCLDVALGTNSYSGNVRPGAPAEVCDGYDTDCTTAGTPPANERDDDNDQYIECGSFVTTTAQNGALETLIGGGDCLDVTLGTNSYSGNVFPTATEACDGYDTDCLGGFSTSSPDETDADDDTYFVCVYVAGGNPAFGGSDCNEGHPLVYPTAMIPGFPGATSGGSMELACTDVDGDGYCIGGGRDDNMDGDCMDAGEDYDSARASAVAEEGWGDCDETLLVSVAANAETIVNLIDEDTGAGTNGRIDEDCLAGGELLITEFYAEDLVDDSNGATTDPADADEWDWFEVANMAWHEISVLGFELTDGTQTTTLTSTAVIERFEFDGGVAVFAADTALWTALAVTVPTILIDWDEAAFTLTDFATDDVITIKSGATFIDSVNYTTASFVDPGQDTASALGWASFVGLELPAQSFGAPNQPAEDHNDDGDNWCAESSQVFKDLSGTGAGRNLKGTPGEANICTP